MRIHCEASESFMHALSTSLSRDPASLEDWRCVHVEHLDEVPFDRYATTIERLKEAHPEADCDIILCPDNDIMLLSRELSEEQLYALADELACNSMVEPCSKPDMKKYDLYHDWRAMRVLLHSKLRDMPRQLLDEKPKAQIYDFGEINSLQDVFAEAKRLRKGRNPVHIMLVEDDPMTRRIVANTFKDNFAMITAHDAHEAIASYLMHAPDIVFLDIGLPDTNGFDVLRQIMDTDPDAYVVMFSGNSYLDNVTTALSEGASGFIAKPFKREKLRHYIVDSAMHHHKSA